MKSTRRTSILKLRGKKPEGAVRGRGDEGSGAETGKKFKIGREKHENLKEQEWKLKLDGRDQK